MLVLRSLCVALAGLALGAAAQPPPAFAPIKTVALPPSSEKGLDMLMIDPDEMPQEPELAKDIPVVQEESWSGAAIDLMKPVHHLYTDLRRQLVRYQMNWSRLPQVRVPVGGKLMKPGASDPRVPILRERLGLSREGGFDEALKTRLMEFQQAHGLKADGTAGADTLEALNRGAAHYERLILLSMERARRLPAPGGASKYVLVDAGSARLWMYEDGRPVDSMKVIVGTPKSETPMLAALIRYANVNPYWNIPWDLVQTLIAPRVLAEGTSYLKDRGYEVLDSWADDAKIVDPATVDWKAAADGSLELRMRQLPGPANSMGEIKFMMPNEFGIYLHDTPNKALFAQDDRWLSNGCVRLEDAKRLARWIFGEMPRATASSREERVDLEKPVPVYITYLTVAAEGNGLAFRADPYERNAPLLARFDSQGDGMTDAEEVALASADPVEAKPEPEAVKKAAPAPAKPKPAATAAVKAEATKTAAKEPAKTQTAAAKADSKGSESTKVAAKEADKAPAAAKSAPAKTAAAKGGEPTKTAAAKTEAGGKTAGAKAPEPTKVASNEPAKAKVESKTGAAAKTASKAAEADKTPAVKTAASKATESKTAESKAAASEKAKSNAAASKTAESKTSASKTSASKATESKTAESKTAESKAPAAKNQAKPAAAATETKPTSAGTKKSAAR
ncbi:MAG TPA: L,D-transpeptidase family protein [Allosphingosinicella sp.]|nr:L,D-transpeptidase family protein [Allosphingosinicella sp.]